MSNSKTIVALLAGAVTGAIAAILLAPARGADSRKYIFGGTSDTDQPAEENAQASATVVNSFLQSNQNNWSSATTQQAIEEERW